MRRILTALVVGNEIWKIIWITSLGLFTHSYLPFHLCSVNIWASYSLEEMPSS